MDTKEITPSNFQTWMWQLQTARGEFLVTVVGSWDREKAAKIVRGIFDIKLKAPITGMIPRKRSSGPDDIKCTVYEQLEPKDELGFDFLAGRKIWELVGRAVEYDVTLEKGLEEV